MHVTHQDNRQRDYSDPPCRSILTSNCVRIVGTDMSFHNVVQMHQHGILNIKIDIYTLEDALLFCAFVLKQRMDLGLEKKYSVYYIKLTYASIFYFIPGISRTALDYSFRTDIKKIKKCWHIC